MKNSARILIVLLVLMTTESMLAQDGSEIIFHKPENPARASAPFSEAVQAGNLFFLAGQIGMNRETNVLPETIQGQTEQTIKNIQGVLEHHGMTLDNVVKCTVILSDIEDFKAFNSVYTQYFTKKPARTTFAAKDLAIGAKIEIDVIAVK
ncbi:RidA family protein [uncultured Croceitalea sp.]|uniref:RidA family protein n=1 Tax=uncultured Croceitalea sp. TaxID=1798908 RepID=UPI003305C7E6